MKNVPYGRKILYKDRHVEIILIDWPPGGRSAAHDHGASYGMIRILSGSVYGKIYSKKTKKFLKRVTAKKGEMMFEAPDIIHIMGNVSKTKHAMAIHAYMPPLKMKKYEDEELG